MQSFFHFSLADHNFSKFQSPVYIATGHDIWTFYCNFWLTKITEIVLNFTPRNDFHKKTLLIYIFDLKKKKGVKRWLFPFFQIIITSLLFELLIVFITHHGLE